ncbi:DNA-binding transcriptional LysR family regulator [Caballeronia udeis]
MSDCGVVCDRRAPSRAAHSAQYNDAIKSLVAAGYGTALLPHEATTSLPDRRIVMRPLRAALWRRLGIAHHAGHVERSTQHVLDA